MKKLNRNMKACAVLILWAGWATILGAQTLTTLHSFDATDGDQPASPLTQAANGGLYGTTESGGQSNGGGGGTFFSITPSGALTTVFAFPCNEITCPDSAGPRGPVIQATDGSFYGTTWGGDVTAGTVFKITPNGALTTLYKFCSQPDCLDGDWPSDGVVEGADGNFFGTTPVGGIRDDCDGYYCGTIFKITAGGTLTTIHEFCEQGRCPDGNQPAAGLALGPDGNLYGTTYYGGIPIFGYGTVFKITPSGTLATLYDFCIQSFCMDGAYPAGTLTLGSDGEFYGTTSQGGLNGCGYFAGGCGTVFKITPRGALTTLHVFDLTDGEFPGAALVQDSSGNFYGTTSEGGAYNGGTIFKITPDGTFATLYNFCSQPNCADGDDSNGLVQDTNGVFYGTTSNGGANGFGTVFSLDMGLGPFVKTNPVAGKVGATVGILGTNLTGATGVKFNGTETAFRVVSSTFIEAKVPSGATSGTVTVQLPSGTLSNNVPFVVLE